MKLKEPKNKNYCATIVEIKTLVPLSNCDNVQHAIIMGNSVVVSKEVKVGDIGLFFPVETSLSDAYLKANNLYRKPELNSDPKEKGYFEENGRIRCVKFRQNKSEGLFMPLNSIDFIIPIVNQDALASLATGINISNSAAIIGLEFDELLGIEICKKYIPKNTKTPGLPGTRKDRTKKFASKIVENQFRFHEDTLCVDFYRNVKSFIG